MGEDKRTVSGDIGPCRGDRTPLGIGQRARHVFGMTRKLTTAVASATVAVLLVGCAHRQRAAEPAATPSPTPPTTSILVTPPATSSSAPAPHVLSDGRHAVYLTAIDVPGRTVTFDVIEFLTGHAADEAFHQDHPEIGEDVPNGFYIRNVDPRLRTLPVRRDVPVRVVWLGDGNAPESISFEALPGYFAGDLDPDDARVWYDPFWLTVRGDRVESIVEQYIP